MGFINWFGFICKACENFDWHYRVWGIDPTASSFTAPSLDVLARYPSLWADFLVNAGESIDASHTDSTPITADYASGPGRVRASIAAFGSEEVVYTVRDSLQVVHDYATHDGYEEHLLVMETRNGDETTMKWGKETIAMVDNSYCLLDRLRFAAHRTQRRGHARQGDAATSVSQPYGHYRRPDRIQGGRSTARHGRGERSHIDLTDLEDAFDWFTGGTEPTSSVSSVQPTPNSSWSSDQMTEWDITTQMQAWFNDSNREDDDPIAILIDTIEESSGLVEFDTSEGEIAPEIVIVYSDASETPGGSLIEITRFDENADADAPCIIAEDGSIYGHQNDDDLTDHSRVNLRDIARTVQRDHRQHTWDTSEGDLRGHLWRFNQDISGRWACNSSEVAFYEIGEPGSSGEYEDVIAKFDGEQLSILWGATRIESVVTPTFKFIGWDDFDRPTKENTEDGRPNFSAGWTQHTYTAPDGNDYGYVYPDYDDYNDGTTVPRIVHEAPHDHPNVFSIRPARLDRFEFVVVDSYDDDPPGSEPGIGGGYYRKESVTHTCELLYGSAVELAATYTEVTGPTSDPDGTLTTHIFNTQRIAGSGTVIFSRSVTQDRLVVQGHSSLTVDIPNDIFGGAATVPRLVTELGSSYPNCWLISVDGDGSNNKPLVAFVEAVATPTFGGTATPFADYNEDNIPLTKADTADPTPTETMSFAYTLRVYANTTEKFSHTVYENSFSGGLGSNRWYAGITGLPKSDADSGDEFGYGYFKTIWGSEPDASGVGTRDNWELHVTDLTATDVWTIQGLTDTNGGTSNNTTTTPHIVDCDDQIIAVEKLWLPVRIFQAGGVVNVALSSGAEVTTTVTGSANVDDVIGKYMACRVSVTNRKLADLRIKLEAPDGTEITLCDQDGGSTTVGGITDAKFMDDAMDMREITSAVDGDSPYSGEWKPSDPFSDLDGVDATDPDQVWTLKVHDYSDGSDGAAAITKFELWQHKGYDQWLLSRKANGSGPAWRFPVVVAYDQSEAMDNDKYEPIRDPFQGAGAYKFDSIKHALRQVATPNLELLQKEWRHALPE